MPASPRYLQSSGKETPPGDFAVMWKDKDHRSGEYTTPEGKPAPMPNSVFFVSGVAFHAGSLSVYSHGCIHLSNAASLKFYNNLAVGDRVQVVP